MHTQARHSVTHCQCLCTRAPPLPAPAMGWGEVAPGGVTVVLITLPLESQSSPSTARTMPPATGLLPPPVYLL